MFSETMHLLSSLTEIPPAVFTWIFFCNQKKKSHFFSFSHFFLNSDVNPEWHSVNLETFYQFINEKTEFWTKSNSNDEKWKSCKKNWFFFFDLHHKHADIFIYRQWQKWWLSLFEFRNKTPIPIIISFFFVDLYLDNINGINKTKQSNKKKKEQEE